MKVDAFFCIRSSGKGAKFSGLPEEFPWALPRGMYQVGMDQSSTRTGIYITDIATKMHMIMHVTRRDEPIDIFFERIRKMLSFIFQNAVLDLFVREEPLHNQRGRAAQVLWKLVGYIEKWKQPYIGIKAMTELSGDKFGSIPPGTWRKHVVDKSKGKHRSTDKYEITMDILDMYPELMPYFHMVPKSSDYDGFEALGILIGYKEEHKLILTNEGTVSTVIAGMKDYFGHVQLYYQFYNQGEEPSMDFVGYFKELFEEREFLVYQPNPDKTFYDNTRIAASKHEVCTIIFRDPMVIRTQLMMFGLKENKDSMITYIIRNSILPSRLRDVLSLTYKGELQTW